MKKIFALGIVTLILALSLAAIAPASAVGPYQAIWDTTTGWNSGTKVNLDSATNSCLASGQGIQLNATGGNYGISLRCPTGSPEISKANLASSYDMSTENGGFVSDFSGNQNHLLDVNTRRTSGVNGGALWFDGSTSVLGMQPSSGFPILLANFTLAVTVFMVGGQGNATNQYGTLFALINTIVFSNRLLIRPNDNTVLFQFGAGPTSVFWTSSRPFLNTWRTVVLVKTFSNASLYVDSFLVSTQAASGFLNCISTCAQRWSGNLAIGDDFSGGFDHFTGAMDNAIVSNRTWTLQEIQNYSRAGSYDTSGSWTSPKVETRNETPTSVILGYRNVSGSPGFGPWISGFTISNASTGLQFTSSGVMTTGNANVTYFTVSVTANGSQIVPHRRLNWTLQVSLQGGGNATAQLIFAAIVFTPLSAVNPLAGAQLQPNTIVIVVALILFVSLMFAAFHYDASILLFLDGFIGIFFGLWLFSVDSGLSWITAIFALVGAIFILFGAIAMRAPKLKVP